MLVGLGHRRSYCGRIAGNQCAGAGFAYLPRVDEAAVQHSVDGQFQVGVVEHDQRPGGCQ